MTVSLLRGGSDILIVEDEPVTQSAMKKTLEKHDFSVSQAFTLAEAWSILSDSSPQAIVLDILLPDGNGLDFLRELRKTHNVPVLIMTAKNATADIIAGLDAGGDDYLVKPCNFDIFVMRLIALIRRASIVPDVLAVGNIRMDISSGKAYYDDMDLGLQQKEFALLQQFIQHPEEMLKAEHLYEKVWGQKMLGQDNTIKVAVSKLRTKLKDTEYTIVAYRGEGYSFERE